MNLGNTIKEIRKQKGFRQNDFADLCKLSQTYLSQIEGNQREPNISTLRIIATNLNISIPILFFMSLDENDIPLTKQSAFQIIGPTVKTLISELVNE